MTKPPFGRRPPARRKRASRSSWDARRKSIKSSRSCCKCSGRSRSCAWLRCSLSRRSSHARKSRERRRKLRQNPQMILRSGAAGGRTGCSGRRTKPPGEVKNARGDSSATPRTPGQRQRLLGQQHKQPKLNIRASAASTVASGRKVLRTRLRTRHRYGVPALAPAAAAGAAGLIEAPPHVHTYYIYDIYAYTCIHLSICRTAYPWRGTECLSRAGRCHS